MATKSTIRRTIAGAAAVPLAFAGLVAVAPSASAFPSRFISETCSEDVLGVNLDIRLKITLRDRHDNDVRKVAVRATDADAPGKFAHDDVELRKMRIKVIGDDGGTNVDTTTSKPSRTLWLDPRDLSEGAEVRRVWVKATFLVDDKVKVKMTCYFHFGQNN